MTDMTPTHPTQASVGERSLSDRYFAHEITWNEYEFLFEQQKQAELDAIARATSLPNEARDA